MEVIVVLKIDEIDLCYKNCVVEVKKCVLKIV